MTQRRCNQIVVALAFLVFAFYYVFLEGVALDYWDTYIAAPATFIAGRAGTFVDGQGQAAYDYDLQYKLPDDLVGKDSYGIVSKDQRIGAGVTFAVAYLAFGMAGFRLFYAAFGALAFLFGYLIGKHLEMSFGLSLVLGLLIAVNPFMLIMNRLNANFITVSIMAGLLSLLLAGRRRWLVIGLVYGALGGIRNEAIMMVPALMVLLWCGNKRFGSFVLFTSGALVGIAPYLAWNKFAFGKMLIHSSQFSDFDGWRPVFEHNFLWWHFTFNGLFNWPFYDHFVRTPHYPFPTYLTLPLVLVLCFGVGLSAFAFVGLWAQWHNNKIVFGSLVLWIAFCLGLFLFQENWEEPKTTFAAMVIVPLAVLMARGMGWLLESGNHIRKVISLLVVVVLLELVVQGAAHLQFPVDQRWYVRFPKAKTEAVHYGCLSDEQRREWVFFHTDECTAELDEQRAKLTRGNLLPQPYYPIHLHTSGLLNEWWQYEPHIFDIWHKIYGF